MTAIPAVVAYANSGMTTGLKLTLLKQAVLPPETPPPASPVKIKTIADQITQAGVLYQFQPSLVGKTKASWKKTYGPDAMLVDPDTGNVSWTIAADLPTESFHFGVEAIDAQGNKSTQVWVLSIGSQRVFYAGPQEVYKTIADGVRAMQSGDTLIVRNGVYLGDEKNFINANSGGAQPPSGTSSAYTTVIAEDPGQVILDGEGLYEELMHIYGNFNEPELWGNTTLKSTPRNYIALKGMHIRNALSSGIRMSALHHIKLIDMGSSDSGRNANCGFTGSSCGTTNIYITRTHHALLEGVYTWGHARYQIIFQKNRDAVVRRAVSRIDAYIGREPVGVFQTYCSNNIVWQNVIAIDSDSKRFWVRHKNLGYSLGFAATGCSYPDNNQYLSSIAINNDLPFTGMNLSNPDGRQYIRNSIGWGGNMTRFLYGNGSIASFMMGDGYIITDQLTLGRVDVTPGYESIEGGSGRAFFYHRKNPLDISNSIVYQMGWDGRQVQNRGRFAWASSELTFDYSNLFGSLSSPLVSSGSYGGSINFNNAIDSDPTQNGLKYLPRIESGASLQSAGKNQQRVGASILMQLGKSGSFNGESGWNVETNIPLWPFPHEDLLKRKFADYSYTGPTRSGVLETVGPNATLSGARGFAAEGTALYGGPITLTSYIWEQLGNPCPVDICGKAKPK
ncbi:hypothetical protein [sulfur-oxidizing endosymbiont of Gigantopelta aegis]|uniref:hypothetical protein n=1 Tax=sulfur-oxidizing endosymbiont of Gigantopelta aegis TaxID=2794934 RepID=UPI0018DD208C|nr:hypothetical protein [sulfur-oxidizing endosymbiont of Gigantopelta aegis]